MKSHTSYSPSLSRDAPAASLEILTPSQGGYYDQRAGGDILLPSPHCPLRTVLCRLLPCVSRSPPRRRAENAVSPVFLARVSHGATVAWKPPPAATITAPDSASPAFPCLLLTRWPRRAGAREEEEEEEESFPARLASSKPRRRSWWRGADGFSGWGNTASCSGKFAEFSPDTRFRKKAPRRGCSWNMGSLGHGSGKKQPTYPNTNSVY